MLEKVEAALVPPRRPWLSVIIDGDDELAVAKKKEEALAEHVAAHPEDAGRTVEDFNWIEWPAAGSHGWLTRRAIGDSDLIDARAGARTVIIGGYGDLGIC
jgi:hypothetical protein